MTLRCRLLIIVASLSATVGVLRQQYVLAVVGLSLVIWICALWLLFRLRNGWMFANIKLDRHVEDQHVDRQPVLWATREFQIKLTATAGMWPPISLGTIRIRDWTPDVLAITEGSTEEVYTSAKSLALSYRVKPLSAGRVVFSGVHLSMQDSLGLFAAERFVESDCSLRCLPAYASSDSMQPTVKRLNSLPQHGIHRLKRAGVGSELLELREYQPGDPPKAIAWKVSARREQLMIRQYEAEVPVRVTMFVDGHPPLRSGRLGHRPIDRFNELAASIAATALRAGDAVGLVRMDKAAVYASQAGFGDRRLHQVLRELADFSIDHSRVIRAITPSGLERLKSICEYRFPQLMDERVNQTKFQFFPITPWKRNAYFTRRKLANLFGVLYELSPIEVCRLVTQDSLLGHYADRMLSDNGHSALVANAMPAPSEAWSQNIAKAITGAVARARDNEIFVILTDIVRFHAQLPKVLEAVKVAVGRHHRVLFVTPEHASVSSGLDSVDAQLVASSKPDDIEAAIFANAEKLAAVEVQDQVRRQIRSVGGYAVFANPENAAGIVLEQAQMVAGGRVAVEMQS
ncbi:MAG TPA: hypothetical protein DDW52_08260 [Planctomycetaceae bacterium]|nr:hypothetical protein [Planctomycetaceae bacterium]